MKTWLGVIALSIIAISCGENAGSGNQEKLQDIPVTTLKLMDTTLYKGYVADIQAVRRVEIRARIRGFLEKIHIDEGEYVRKGEPVFSIGPQEYTIDLAKASANLKNAIAEAKVAELEVNRIKLLVDKNVISSSELDIARAKLDAVNATVEESRSAENEAQNRLSYTVIRAPFDGFVDQLPLKEGSVIDEGALLTTIAHVNEVYAYFNVSENEYLSFLAQTGQNDLRNNTKVRLVLSNNAVYPHEGVVETMLGGFEEGTGSIAFRARFPNPERMLKHGATGRIDLATHIKGGLLLPQKSVFEIQDKNFVYLVDTAETVRMQSFIPQSRFSSFYLVNSGLKPGDRIVYEGHQNIRDGVTINPVMVPMDSLVSIAH